MFHRSIFVCVICVAAVLETGCYRSHTRADESGTPEPTAMTCPPPVTAASPSLMIDVLDHLDRYTTAGTPGMTVLSFRLSNLSDRWIEPAEFPVRFRALDVTFPAEGRPPFFRNARFLVNGMPTTYGPEDMSRESDTEGSVYLRNAWGARPGQNYRFTLVVDVARDAVGKYEIMAGDSCQMLDRVWYVDDPGGRLGDRAPVEIIGNNVPIVTRVTIQP